MVNYNSKSLKKILIFVILFFVLSVNIFLYVYSSLNLHSSLVQKFDSKKTLIIDLNDNLKYEKDKLAQIKILKDSLELEYRALLDKKLNSNSNIKSSSSQIIDLNAQITLRERNIAQLKSDISTLKQII